MEAFLAAKEEVAEKAIALAHAEGTWARARQANNTARPKATGLVQQKLHVSRLRLRGEALCGHLVLAMWLSSDCDSVDQASALTSRSTSSFTYH